MEIRTLPQKPHSQCLLTVQARRRKAATISNHPFTPTPQEVSYNAAAASHDSTIHWVEVRHQRELFRRKRTHTSDGDFDGDVIQRVRFLVLVEITPLVDLSQWRFIPLHNNRSPRQSVPLQSPLVGAAWIHAHTTLYALPPQADGMVDDHRHLTRMHFLLPPLSAFFSSALAGSASRWHHQHRRIHFRRSYRSAQCAQLVVGSGVSTGSARCLVCGLALPVPDIPNGV